MAYKHFKILAFTVLCGIMSTYYLSDAVLLSADLPFDKFNKYLPGSYSAKLYDIHHQKTLHQETFHSAESINSRFDFINFSEKELVKLIEQDIFPHWYDTKYDFYGTTETPGKGKIACGYFVTTVLRDVGVPIERIKMAQAASEKMIKTMVDENKIQRFRRVPIKKFIYAVEDMGEGLYVVGLDTHAGFILYDGEEVRFIHSTGRKEKRVINEKAVTSPSLIRSKYRVVGKITGDEDFVKRWLRHQNS